MAANEIITTEAQSLSDDIESVINHAFMVRAMLQGVNALLENAEALPDPDGDVWAARELVAAAIVKVEKIYEEADTRKLSERARACAVA